MIGKNSWVLEALFDEDQFTPQGILMMFPLDAEQQILDLDYHTGSGQLYLRAALASKISPNQVQLELLCKAEQWTIYKVYHASWSDDDAF